VKIDMVTVGPFQENCYLVSDETTGRAALIDPGDEPARILAMVRASRCALDAIWLTHAHLDHVGAVAAVVAECGVPVYLHPADRPLYDRVADQARSYGLTMEAPPPPDHDLAEGDVMTVGSLKFDVVHLPGHAPGHVAFLGHGISLSGDLLFAGSIGRTDLPLSNPAHMADSLERLAAWEAATVVHPGHGPLTTIDAERRSNPFLTGSARVLRA